ncbi:MAG: hypothetical protein R2940_08270 [Syntrophotaleaceae bacterium]
MRHTKISLLAAAMFGFLLVPPNGLAQDDSPQFITAFLELGQAASEDELVLESGGQAMEIDKIYMQLNEVGMNANMDGNALESNSTGMNLIGSDAFSNMNGFATVIQNSGNQVIIQSDLIVNVDMH